MAKAAPAWGCRRVMLLMAVSFVCGALFGGTYVCPQLELLFGPLLPAATASTSNMAPVASTQQVADGLASSGSPNSAKRQGGAALPVSANALRSESPASGMVQRPPQATTPVPARTSSQNAQASVNSGEAKSRLRVAFAVFVTDISSAAWDDALAVLAFSLQKAKKKSRHSVENIVLAPERLEASKADSLLAAGFDRIVKKPIPVMPSEVKRRFAQEHLERVQGKNGPFTFLMAEELIKYWGIALVEYDRVLVLDADVMVLDPMDELFEMDADFIGVYDHGLDSPSSTMPPAQGGFLLFKPNLADFEAIKELTREGDWDGAGWKRSGIGFCYGGVGPDGLLQYYYNKDSLSRVKQVTKKRLPEGQKPERIEGSRWMAVDREVYDVVVNKRLRDELDPKDHAKSLADVKSVHFTGDCVKPWSCFTSGAWFCKGLLDKWWQMRAELEAQRGLPPSERRCSGRTYTPLGKK